MLHTFASVSGSYYRDRGHYSQREPYDNWHQASGSRSPDRRREQEDRDRRPYYEEQRRYSSRDYPPRDRYPYPEPPPEHRYREEQYDRRASYQPFRGSARDQERDRRDQERDRYAHETSSRTHRASWNGAAPPSRSSFSPPSSLRSSPSRAHSPVNTRTSRTSIPNERRDDPTSRRPSQNPATVPRKEDGIPTGPRSMMAPSSSYNRPPTGPGNAYNDRGGAVPNFTNARDEPPRQLNRRVDDEGVPLTVFTDTATQPVATSTSWDEATKEDGIKVSRDSLASDFAGEKQRGSIGDANKSGESRPLVTTTVTNQAVPEMSVADAAAAKKASVFYGSVNVELEAKCHEHTTTRLRSLHSLYATEPFVALRKSLQELADSEMELSGARVKTSVAETALNQAKEDAEQWSLECGRIEINEKNSGILGYFAASSG